MKDNRLVPELSVFEKLLGGELSAQSGGADMRFKLTEVSKLPPTITQTGRCIRQNAFSLLVKEVTNFKPDQGIFTLDTDLGVIDLFLVPVGSGEYEAIFN